MARLPEKLVKRQRFLVAWSVLLAVLWLWSYVTWSAWGQAQDVYTRDLPPEAVAIVEYSAWSWSARSGMVVDYIGTTDEWCLEDAIVYRRADFEEWANNKLPIFGGWDAFTADCFKGSGKVVVWNPVSRFSTSLTLHEMGHSLGFWNHLEDPQSTMYPIAGSNGLTTSDVLAVLTSPGWALRREPALCFVELRPDWRLYLPDFNGQRIVLDYLFVIDGHHRWAVKSVEPNPDTQGCSGSYRLSDGNVWLDDIRSEAGRWAAEFEPVGGGGFAAVRVEAL